MARAARPKIFKYSDIIVFLTDVMEFYKRVQKKSLRDISEDLQFSSGFLPLILSRKRTLNEDVLEKILGHFKFNAKEIAFAKSLRVVGFSEDASERDAALKAIGKFKAYRESNQSEFEIYKYLSHWYYVAIKEMTELNDFKEDSKWIQDRLCYKVSQKDIEDALQFLKDNRILAYSGGRLKAVNRDLNCEEGIYKISLGSFHKQVLDLAWRAIDEVPREKRRLLGHTLKIDSKKIEEANAILAEAFEKLKQLHSDEKNQEEIYHFELISIPMTRKAEK